MLTQEKQFQLKFTGKGSEYFRIWIVNLILTLLTFGIFSAWAQLRRIQYFYHNTWLNESNFNYHASPISILKGKIITATIFLLYFVSFEFNSKIGYAVLSILILIFPLTFVLSMRFRIYNSSYRGLRFNFSGSIKEAYINLLLFPLLNLFTLFLLTPFVHRRIKLYQHNNYNYGKTKFNFNASVKNFYKIYFITFIQYLSISLFFFVGYFVLYEFTKNTNMEKNNLLITIILLILCYLFFPFTYFMVRIQNLIWNHTVVGNNQFISTLKFKSLLKLEITNYILIIITFGFYKPFADIRMARYYIENMSISTTGDLDNFLACEQQNVTATGAETGTLVNEIFNIDIRI